MKLPFGVRRAACGVMPVYYASVSLLSYGITYTRHFLRTVFNTERRTPNAERILLTTLILSVIQLPAVDNSGVRLSNAWARASSPSAEMGAAYVTLINNGDIDEALVSASCDMSAEVELHTHIKDAQGLLHMEQVERIIVPAKSQIVMKPGSFHFMLIDLKRQLIPGATLLLTCQWASGAQSHISAPVLEAGSTGPVLSSDPTK